MLGYHKQRGLNMKKIHKTDITIKPLQKNLPHLSSIIDQMLQLEATQHISILSKQAILQDLEQENYHYYYMMICDEIVGYLSFSTVADTMDLQSIVIAKPWQRHHLASLLLDKMIQFAR